MISFEVMDMSCGHCANSITQAVAAIDGAAKVRVDLQAHRVEIDPGDADAEQLRNAIETAGFTPVVIAAGG